MNYVFSMLAVLTNFGFVQTGNQTYFEQNVRPVIEAKCASCHSGMAGQDWTQYNSAKRAISKINFRVFVLKNMPPMSSAPLSTEEAGVLRTWIDAEKGKK